LTKEVACPPKTLAIIPVFRDAKKITGVIRKFHPGLVTEVCVVVDSPDPDTIDRITDAGRAFTASFSSFSSERKYVRRS